MGVLFLHIDASFLFGATSQRVLYLLSKTAFDLLVRPRYHEDS